MLNLTGWFPRLAYAILYAVITFVVLLIVAYVLRQFPPATGIGDIIERFAGIIALLVGIVTFLAGPGRTNV